MAGCVDDDVEEEDFMNPTLMAPQAIRLRYTPAEVRIFPSQMSPKVIIMMYIGVQLQAEAGRRGDGVRGEESEDDLSCQRQTRTKGADRI